MIDLNELAKRQLSDYKNNKPGTCFVDPDLDLDISSAYRLQDAVTRLRLEEGDKVAGYKVGCIGDDVKRQFGMNGPIRGTIFQSEIFKTNISLEAQSFCNLAIEAEMAIILGADGQIEYLFPVIELHNLVFRAPKKNLPELIGNNGINCGLVVTNRELRVPIEDLDKLGELLLQINDSTYITTQLWPIGDKPSGSLNWLRNNLARYNKKIVPHNIVLLGTTLGLYPVGKGDQITVNLNGKPLVGCSII